jgi:uncharacterized protein (DUF4415 family)
MKSETDWARLDAMTDEQIERAVAEDPDQSFWTEEEWARARVMVPLALHLDADVVNWFMSQGDGYPARINDVLRAFVEAQKAKG